MPINVSFSGPPNPRSTTARMVDSRQGVPRDASGQSPKTRVPSFSFQASSTSAALLLEIYFIVGSGDTRVGCIRFFLVAACDSPSPEITIGLRGVPSGKGAACGTTGMGFGSVREMSIGVGIGCSVLLTGNGCSR
jgi:hypothetical protein